VAISWDFAEFISQFDSIIACACHRFVGPTEVRFRPNPTARPTPTQTDELTPAPLASVRRGGPLVRFIPLVPMAPRRRIRHRMQINDTLDLAPCITR
jgi:hypothetical protein